MEIHESLEIVTQLTNGIDPFVYAAYRRRVHIIRAARKSRRTISRRRHGESRARDEDLQLSDGFNEGRHIKVLAEIHDNRKRNSPSIAKTASTLL